MDFNILSLSFSGLLMICHIIGGLFIIWGTWRLLQGIQGEGQSAQGVSLLRMELIGIFKPLILGILAVMLLLGLAMWERSPLTQWIQVIAPISTVIWVFWSHSSSRKIRPGELFEALVPLALKISPELDQRAKSWVNESPPLNSRGLMHTAFQAVQDAQDQNQIRKSLSVEVTLQITQDSLRELYEATLRFPLGQQLTLTDWIYEGDRLSRHWGRGLQWITRGRALLNPLTLLDYKGLWRWSKGSPADLFQLELAAWLHRGLYVLVFQKMRAHLIEEDPTFSPMASEESASVNHQKMSDEASSLWELIAFKLTVPFWLYLVLSSAALIVHDGWIGAVISVLAAGVLGYSVKRVTALSAWREAFARLATHKRTTLPQEGRIADEVRGMLVRLNNLFTQELRSKQTPCMSLIHVTQQGWSELSQAYRRELPDLKEANPVLNHINVTLPDLIATLYWLCDDLKRFSDSKAGNLLKGLSEYFGDQLSGGFEPMVLDAIQQWSLEGDHEQISSHETEDEGHELQNIDALTQRAQQADQWITNNVYEAGFLIKTVAVPILHSTAEGVQGWIQHELLTRLTPLYRGDVPPPPQSTSD